MINYKAIKNTKVFVTQFGATSHTSIGLPIPE